VKIPCPQCGGDVQLQETTGFVGCPFCGISLVLDLTGVRRHMLFRPRHGQADVLPLVRRWCDAHSVLPPSRVSRPRLVYRPFWRYVRLGQSCLVPAWPTIEHRWTEVPVPNAAQVLFDPSLVRGAEVVEPSVAEAAARSRAFGEDAASTAAGDLVHVPFYDAQATIERLELQIAMDACAGRVYSNRMPPGAESHRTGQAFALPIAILGFLGMFFEAMLIPLAWLAAIVVAATALALYWALVSGLRRERSTVSALDGFDRSAAQK